MKWQSSELSNLNDGTLVPQSVSQSAAVVTTQQDIASDQVIGQASAPYTDRDTEKGTPSTQQQPQIKKPKRRTRAPTKKKSRKRTRAPTNQMNSIYIDGNQARIHGRLQGHVDLHGPWVQMTGKDREERRARKAETKRLRNSDDDDEGTAASGSKSVKRSRTSADELELDDSTLPGQGGQVITGSGTLHKTHNETTGSSAAGEGPSTLISQTFSLGSHEE